MVGGPVACLDALEDEFAFHGEVLFEFKHAFDFLCGGQFKEGVLGYACHEEVDGFVDVDEGGVELGALGVEIREVLLDLGGEAGAVLYGFEF